MKPPNFDPIARIYRLAEYLTLGPNLQRTRTHHLPALTHTRQALLLGDGDGRFTASLLATNPHLQAHAVDLSSAMLTRLRRNATPHLARLTTTLADALTYPVPAHTDLIVTHFFLDCLTQPQLDTLVPRLAAALPPSGLWLFSDFRIPPGPLALPARLYIRALYLAFRLLTGLRVTHLPDHETPFRAAGLTPIATHRRLFGLLTTELWQNAP